MKQLAFFLIGNLLLFSCAEPSKQSAETPNIVLILADDLGYGDLSSYGNTTINTPNIDYLASQGVKFTDFHYNGAVCSPTRAALMTGKYQQRTGVEGVITAKSHREVGLHLDEMTIADELKQYDYNCGIYGKWHLGYPASYNPVLQGFDDFVGFVSGNVDYHAHIDQEGYLDWWKKDSIDNEKGYTTDLITDYGVKFIKENNPQKTKKPFFLYLPHEAPHGPYQRRIDKTLRTVGTAGTLPVDNSELKSIYKEMVEVMDEGIGKIVESLKETGSFENTIIIFASDNGANARGSNGVLRGYKGNVYEGGSRVPAIISYGDKLQKGSINEQTVMTMDLLPTLLDFAGQKPSDASIDGVSIKSSLLEKSDLKERDLFFAFKNKSFIRSENYKLIKIMVEGEDKLELYDLASDLSESNNIAEANPEMAAALNQRLTAWEKEVRRDVAIVSK